MDIYREPIPFPYYKISFQSPISIRKASATAAPSCSTNITRILHYIYGLKNPPHINHIYH